MGLRSGGVSGIRQSCRRSSTPEPLCVPTHAVEGSGFRVGCPLRRATSKLLIQLLPLGFTIITLNIIPKQITVYSPENLYYCTNAGCLSPTQQFTAWIPGSLHTLPQGLGFEGKRLERRLGYTLLHSPEY